MPGGLVSTETGGEVLRPVATLGELTLVDEVDAGAPLPVAHLGHRFGEALLRDIGPSPDVVRSRQGADMGGEDPVRATSHDVPQRSSDWNPVSADPTQRLSV
jgi:hypothetical protein